MANPHTARLNELIKSDNTRMVSMEHVRKIAEQARRAHMWAERNAEYVLPEARSEDEGDDDDIEDLFDGDGDEPTHEQLQAAANGCVKDCYASWPNECTCEGRVIVQLKEGASVSDTIAAITDAEDRFKMSPTEYQKRETRRRETVKNNKETDKLIKKKKNQDPELAGGKRKRPKPHPESVGREPSPSLSIHK